MLKTLIASIVFFPATLFRLSFWLPRKVMHPGRHKYHKQAWGLITYLLIGIPLTIAIFFEVLILLNGQIVGEPSNYQFSVTKEDMLEGRT